MTELKEITKHAFNRIIEGKAIIHADASNNRSLVLTLETQEQVSLLGAYNGYLLYYKGDVNSYCKALEEEFSTPTEEVVLYTSDLD